MKVLTIKQPWATLIVKGYKEYEFRSWKTKYRGEILIHAGKGVDKDWIDRLKELGLEFPSSKIVGKVSLVDCIEFGDKLNDEINKKNPLVYGNKNRTGYAWRLENAEEISSSKKINGKLSFWDIQKEEYM